MEWEVGVIEFLQKGSGKFLDSVMLFLTQAGDELFFFVAVIAVYLCVNKRTGYKFLCVYLMGALVINVIKPLVARPRPFDKYPDRIKSIGSKTHGKSFPSGHSNSIASLSTLFTLNFPSKRKMFAAIGTALTVTVMFTRLYLGQHYFTDVLAGAALGIGSAILFGYLFELLKDKEELIMFGVIPLSVILATVFLIKDGASANDTVFKAFGAWSAISVGYYIDKKRLKFDLSFVSVKVTVIRLLIGYSGAVLIAFGLNALLPLFDALNALICYVLLGLYVSLGAPALFRILKLEKQIPNEQVAQE